MVYTTKQSILNDINECIAVKIVMFVQILLLTPYCG